MAHLLLRPWEVATRRTGVADSALRRRQERARPVDLDRPGGTTTSVSSAPDAAGSYLRTSRSIASSNDAESVAANLVIVPALVPIKNDGVPRTPASSAARSS